MASLEAVLRKHFNNAEKNANERFDRIETQLDKQATLNKHTEEIDKQRNISSKLQERIKKAETTASIHGDSRSNRDRILKEARGNPVEVDGHTIQFTTDYSDHTSKLRRPCFPVMHRARQLGYQAFLLYPAVIKLIRGSEQYLFCDPSEAEKFLCPEEDNPAD
ncbi:hypothetical protein ABVT39_010103 [Epinephelus coioides]